MSSAIHASSGSFDRVVISSGTVWSGNSKTVITHTPSAPYREHQRTRSKHRSVRRDAAEKASQSKVDQRGRGISESNTRLRPLQTEESGDCADRNKKLLFERPRAFRWSLPHRRLSQIDADPNRQHRVRRLQGDDAGESALSGVHLLGNPRVPLRPHVHSDWFRFRESTMTRSSAAP